MCVCVTLGIIGILLDLLGLLSYFLTLFQQGAHGHLDGMGQRRPIQAVVKTYLLGAPGRIIRRSWWPPFFLPFCKVLVSSADLHATTSPCRSVVGLRFGPLLLLKTSRIRGSYLYLRMVP